MSQRTKYNKSKQKAIRGELKTKAWKQTLEPMYTTTINKSRAGIMYENRIKADKLLATAADNHSLLAIGIRTYLQSLPFVGRLFQ